MKHINHLLKKYSKPYTPGEQTTTHYNTQIKQQQRLKDKENTAQQLFQETPFHLTQHEKQQVIHVIHTYTNFKKLHRKASNETIILAFIFYIKMSNKQIKLDRYTITTKYQLTHTTFELIICRLVKNHFQNTYITPTTNTTLQHSILEKGELK